MANSYDVNDVVRLTGTFRSTSGVLTDPTKVTFVYEAPNSTSLVTRTSTVASVVHPSVGIFYTDVVITGVGVYEYRIFSTGTLRTSTQGWWRVRTQRAV